MWVKSVQMLFMAGVLSGALAMKAASDGELLPYYEAQIQERPSGVYEYDGWVFFHQRVPVSEEGAFAEMRALKKALPDVSRRVLDRIESLAVSNGVPSPHIVSVLQDLLCRTKAPKFPVERSFSGMPTRCLSQEVVGRDFVYSLAVRMADLQKESLKGVFENRPEFVEKVWCDFARKSFAKSDNHDFLKACGVYDLVPSVADLKANSDPKSLKEYDRLASKLQNFLKHDLDKYLPASVSVTNSDMSVSAEDYRNIRSLMLGSDGRLLAVQFEWSRDLIAFDDYLQNCTNAEDGVRLMCRLLAHTPGSRLYWMELGESWYRQRQYYLAIVCFRLALRLNRVRNVTLPLLRLAQSYRALGYRRLGENVAALVFALDDDKQNREESLDILRGEK